MADPKHFVLGLPGGRKLKPSWEHGFSNQKLPAKNQTKFHLLFPLHTHTQTPALTNKYGAEKKSQRRTHTQKHTHARKQTNKQTQRIDEVSEEISSFHEISESFTDSVRIQVRTKTFFIEMHKINITKLQDSNRVRIKLPSCERCSCAPRFSATLRD